MTTGEFLERLSRLGIRVWAEGANVCLNALKGVLTPVLRLVYLMWKECVS